MLLEDMTECIEEYDVDTRGSLPINEEYEELDFSWCVSNVTADPSTATEECNVSSSQMDTKTNVDRQRSLPKKRKMSGGGDAVSSRVEIISIMDSDSDNDVILLPTPEKKKKSQCEKLQLDLSVLN